VHYSAVTTPDPINRREERPDPSGLFRLKGSFVPRWLILLVNLRRSTLTV
jgi:hypothetical protein